ncbi:MAG: hypothetical protein NT149_01245 [Candidatus Gottesmanbacteria bacterium]|nr:hypothetical protein [Candidatus Gottesmanbacteria bacterium]
MVITKSNNPVRRTPMRDFFFSFSGSFTSSSFGSSGGGGGGGEEVLVGTGSSVGGIIRESEFVAGGADGTGTGSVGSVGTGSIIGGTGSTTGGAGGAVTSDEEVVPDGGCPPAGEAGVLD